LYLYPRVSIPDNKLNKLLKYPYIYILLFQELGSQMKVLKFGMHMKFLCYLDAFMLLFYFKNLYELCKNHEFSMDYVWLMKFWMDYGCLKVEVFGN